MQCHDICEMLSGYIDDVLSPEEKQRVEKHVTKCSTCAGELRDLQQTVRLLQSLGDVMPPAGFREELMGKLAQEASADISSISVLPVKSNKSKLLKLPPVWRYAAAAVIVLTLGSGVAAGIFYDGMDKLAPESRITAENRAKPDQADEQERLEKFSSQQELALRSAEEALPGTMAHDQVQDNVVEQGAVKESAPKKASETTAVEPPVKTHKQKLPDRSSAKTKEPGPVKPPEKDMTAGAEYSNQIIKSAQINMNVGSYQSFENHVKNVVSQYGGVMTGSSTPYGGEFGRISFKVPEKEFGNVLAQIEAGGTVTSEEISGRSINSNAGFADAGQKGVSIQGGQNPIPQVESTGQDTSFSYIEINILEGY